MQALKPKLLIASLSFMGCLFLTSCTEIVTDRFPAYEAIPTVNAILVAGEPISIHVSLTGGLDSLPLPNVNDAKINLFTNGQFTEQLGFTADGFYTSKAIVTPDNEYRCEVIIANFDTVICSQTIPEPTPILNVEHINNAGRNEEGQIYHAIKVTFRNNKSELKYYEIEGGYHTFTDRVLLNEGLPIALFSNAIIDDSVCTITLNYGNGFNNIRDGHYIIEPFTVKMRSVTYDYYRYQKQNQIGVLGNANYSNIENGYGIFAGYSVFTSDTITPEPYEIN